MMKLQLIFSCCLQKDNLVYSEVKPKLEATLAGLHELHHGGNHFSETCRQLEENNRLKGLDLGDCQWSKAEVISLIDKYIDSLTGNLYERLTQQNGDVLCNLSVVLSPDLFDEDMADDAINDLWDLFEREKTVNVVDNNEVVEIIVQPLTDINNVKVEWQTFKAMIKGTYRNISMESLCRNIILMHSEMLPAMSVIM